MMNTRALLRVLAFCLVLALPAAARAASKEELDALVRESVQELYKTSSAAKELGARSAAMLVFPRIYKAGIGIGGEFGEGALLAGSKTSSYYMIASASIGLQLGIQRKSVVIMFMTPDALRKFRDSEGFKIGVDASVAIATLGADGAIDTETMKKPIIGFVFSNQGLMYNLTLEGSKITKIEK
jgi:lipid-binding SYLF domain-containing protein